MKRWTTMIIIAITLLFISGCQINSTYDENLSNINRILTNFSLDESYGYDYSSIQKDAEDRELNKDTITQRIDRETEVKIYTEVESYRLNTFNLDSQYEITNYVVYFYNNQKGIQHGDDAIIWESTTYEEYNLMTLPIQRIDADNLSAYDVQTSENLTIITCNVKIDKIEKVLGYTISNISELTLVVTFDATEDRLIEIEVSYQQTLSNTVVTFKPNYDIVQVIIP